MTDETVIRTSKTNHSPLLIELQDLERWLENRDMMESANTCRKAVKALSGDTPETCEWCTAGVPRSVDGQRHDSIYGVWACRVPAQKSRCGLCAEGMNSFTDPDTGKKMHARNGVVTVCTALKAAAVPDGIRPTTLDPSRSWAEQMNAGSASETPDVAHDSMIFNAVDEGAAPETGTCQHDVSQPRCTVTPNGLVAFKCAVCNTSWDVDGMEHVPKAEGNYCVCGKSQLVKGQRGYYCKGCGKDLHPDNYNAPKQELI